MAGPSPGGSAAGLVAHPLLLYDGVCGLCNRLVGFILRRDPGGGFRFASLQSPLAGRILARHGADATDLDTVYVVVNCGQADEELLPRSDAVIFILGHLGAAEQRSAGQPGTAVPTQATPTSTTPTTPTQAKPTSGSLFWRFAGLLLQLVPRRVRDWGYRMVARKRYRIFGRYDACPVPSEKTRWRFLDH
jgi:predicted DCC family thiol-disulfide oxidoreductase YuxK